ncbi:MAG: [acyl-carrier-protein] S-malonyltransferase [Deltaproteobacteria bacterium]|nr:[acyl-carrier-protein] S-malonyltransferase [Deltaproteobacteria bacterium]TLN04754.1 MAG: ACP S-malonyltransferase [bacterium]
MEKCAFLFPGQGSQYPGMGKELAANFAIVRQTFEEADDALGSKLSRICFDGPEGDLLLTENTQPALLATSTAFYRLIKAETGLQASYFAGHSLGEYSALVAAGSLDFADALRTVRARGGFMQDAVPVGTGAMAAILGAEPEVVEAVCAEAAQGEVVVPANFNCPGQIVISGHASAVNRVIEIAKNHGIRKVLLLPVSVPSHCSLMAPAGDKLAAVLDAVSVTPLEAPVISNVEAKANSAAERVKELLVAQVSSPVLWEASVKEMVALGVTRVVEVGPGKVLSGLVKKIDKNLIQNNFDDVAGFSAFIGEVA